MHLSDVVTVDKNLSFIDLVEAHKKVDESGFTGTGRSDDGDAVASVDVQVHIRNKRFILGIAERNVLEINFSGKPADVATGRFFGLLRKVEHLEDTLRAGNGRLNGAGDVTDVFNRLGKLFCILDTRLYVAYGYDPQAGAIASENTDTDVRDIIDKFYKRQNDTGKKLSFSCRVQEHFIDHFEFFDTVLLVTVQ